MTPLSLSLLNPSLEKLIQYSLIDSFILSNTYTQLGFSSSYFLGDFPKSLNIFATSDMDDRKEISSINSIDFDESTKIYANSYFMPHSDNHRKNYSRPIYEIENVISEYSTAATGVSNIPLTPLLPMSILAEQNLSPPLPCRTWNFPFKRL